MDMASFCNERLSFEHIRTYPVRSRTNLVTIRNMARPYEDPPPEWPVGRHMQERFEQLVGRIVEARAAGRPVIWSMGAHVIKNGLSRYVIEMVRQRILTHVSGNGATSIHDFELAFLGETSEDVARAIEDGSFGMWEETGRYMNEAIRQGAAAGLGYGESLYRYLESDPERFPYADDCVFVQCRRSGVPYTCHISIGTDIIHQHPTVDFADLGCASGRDFESMCRAVAGLRDGGVFLNFGSAISGPELFLKALSMARNAGRPMRHIVAANFDILPVAADGRPSPDDADFHYRPRRNFIDRLQQLGGQGYLFHGLHQATIPHLFRGILRRRDEQRVEFPPYDRRLHESVGKRTLFPVSERVALLHARQLPELSAFHRAAPSAATPSVATPSVATPSVATPSVATPSVATPSVATPSVATPSVAAPSVAAVPEPPFAGWQPRNGADFVECAERWADARRDGRHVLVSLGGNVVGSGVSPYLIDLIDRGAITHVAVNGACAFQDFELAAFGQTEESDDPALSAGKLGMWREPGEWLHEALRTGYAQGLGYGESLYAYMRAFPGRFPYVRHSLIAVCGRNRVPFTVHITIGTDAVQQHPAADFTVQGGASGRDFQAYAATTAKLEGGLFLNFGSTVTGPEVFLKALSIVRNVGHTVRRITTANFDIVKLGDYKRKVGYEDWDYYYRPRKNIIHRPTSLGGKGYHFEGLHQETVPALWREWLRRGVDRRQGGEGRDDDGT